MGTTVLSRARLPMSFSAEPSSTPIESSAFRSASKSFFFLFELRGFAFLGKGQRACPWLPPKIPEVISVADELERRGDGTALRAALRRAATQPPRGRPIPRPATRTPSWRSCGEHVCSDEDDGKSPKERGRPQRPLAYPAEPAHGQCLVDAHRGEPEQTYQAEPLDEQVGSRKGGQPRLQEAGRAIKAPTLTL